MSKSIVQTEKECYLCRELFGVNQTYGLEEHHCIPGTARRRLSEKHGLKVWLCASHHRTGQMAVHRNATSMAYVKAAAQEAFEKLYGHDKFMQIFGRNYL